MVGTRDRSSECRRRIVEIIVKDTSEIRWSERLRDEERRVVTDRGPSEPDQGGVALTPPEHVESRPAGNLEPVDGGGLHWITWRGAQREPRLCVTHFKVLTQVGAGDTVGRGTAHEDEDTRAFCDSACDDVTGAALDPKEVQRARLKEVEYIHKKGVYKKIRRQDKASRSFVPVG